MPEIPPHRRWSASFRSWLRALHRDAGYLAVGLTFVYAASGLAVNHIKDWDPSFQQTERERHVEGPFPDDDQAAARKVLAALAIPGTPREAYRSGPTALDIVFDKRTLHVNTRTGAVLDETEEPRPLLRVANWLHLNRGKKAWTLIADGYAVFLLFLATSGVFMIPGKKGLFGRGALLVGLGAAIPVLYVVLSGGP
jgi:uncharacterized protein